MSLPKSLASSICLFCGHVVAACDCARCSICGSRRHHESQCPDRPGDALEEAA